MAVGNRFVGTPRIGFGASEMGRDYRLGYGLTVLQRGAMSFDLGIDAAWRQSRAMWAPSTAFKAGSRRAGEYGTVWGHSFGKSPIAQGWRQTPLKAAGHLPRFSANSFLSLLLHDFGSSAFARNACG